MGKLIEAELRDNYNVFTPTQAVERVLEFLRRWAEFHFPRFLSALDKIQRHVFSQSNMQPGNYEIYVSEIKRLFMPLSATVLEEYGVPYQISLQIEQHQALGETVDEILASLPTLAIDDLSLTSFEKELLQDAIDNL